ncbi:MAG: enoyl-CoA hydratase/isomerase family protein [Chloroflexi bacterium]|nr:enoyl-CoA hydratase/isomerase family protein [Chloroflexota bacterium]
MVQDTPGVTTASAWPLSRGRRRLAEDAWPPHRVSQLVRRAAVLGSGTMGSQIAGLLASNGIPCDLLDLPSEGERNRLAESAKKRLTTLRPPPLYSVAALSLVRPGNFQDDLPRLKEADWVLEAVVENLDTKKQLWSRVAPHLRPDVIASTNTSGIPIATIAEALPRELRPRFLGTHFSNPPRYLRLLEVVPTPQTSRDLVGALCSFGETVLGKGVVVARDVPYFILNRIGIYGLMVILRAMEEFRLRPDEVDSITGPAMGRPGSATFRTFDLIGLDVFASVGDNLLRLVRDPRERAMFELPEYIRDLVRRGWTGEKAGQGFYKRADVGGESQVMALQLDTFQYGPRRGASAPSLAAVRQVEDPAERLRTLVNADDLAGRFAWRVLAPTLAYAARMVGVVSDDIASIDHAMRWGFAWELGPFETWDALGVARTLERMQGDGLQPPPWVVDLAEGGQTFYRHQLPHSLQATPRRTYAPVPQGKRTINVEGLLATGRRLSERPGATLYDLGDGVALLDFHSPKQAIGPDMLDMLEEVSQRLPGDVQGLVVSSHVRPNFCVGANLMLLLLAAQEGDWDQVASTIRRFQQALLLLKRLAVPVVVAPYGATLGGGAELALSAHATVAAMECSMGLVETGAGLIPSGGGCKEMLLRALEGLPGGIEGFLRRRRGGAPVMIPEPDPTPAVARVFETIGLAKVSGSAPEARTLGFLRPADVVVPNVDHLLSVAKETSLAQQAQGFAPPPPARLPVLGEGVRALLELEAQHLVWAGQASEHDLKIARKLAHVLTGGDRPAGADADEEYFLDLEREAFLSLCGEPKTQARMQHLVQTGRPLRN